MQILLWGGGKKIEFPRLLVVTTRHGMFQRRSPRNFFGWNLIKSNTESKRWKRIKVRQKKGNQRRRYTRNDNAVLRVKRIKIKWVIDCNLIFWSHSIIKSNVLIVTFLLFFSLLCHCLLYAFHAFHPCFYHRSMCELPNKGNLPLNKRKLKRRKMSIEINASLLPFLWDFFIEFSGGDSGEEKDTETDAGKFNGKVQRSKRVNGTCVCCFLLC